MKSFTLRELVASEITFKDRRIKVHISEFLWLMLVSILLHRYGHDNYYCARNCSDQENYHCNWNSNDDGIGGERIRRKQCVGG